MLLHKIFEPEKKQWKQVKAQAEILQSIKKTIT